ncbi:MAG TPA: RecQ family ATP-dependent DNA helicase [Spirochaetia bacterium]|nr:RecQ family ATP-dependent DNA helicase [Spirochaetia bacterium]
MPSSPPQTRAALDTVQPRETEDAELACPDPLTEYARTRFGIGYLYPYQRLVVANLLDAAAGLTNPDIDSEIDVGDAVDAFEAHRYQIVILPTGAGKSLCFQLPAEILPGPTVIVYPLLSLLADQARRLAEAGIPAILLRGGQSHAEREISFRKIRDGSARVILSNPETLASNTVKTFLSQAGCVHIVVDEAHCIFEWGRTFRPAYLLLSAIIREIGIPLVTAFTATASPPVLAAIRELLFNDEVVHLIEGNPDRPNISYRVVPTLSKLHTLKRLLAPEAHSGESIETVPLDNRAPGMVTPKAEHAAHFPPQFPAFEPVRRPAVVFCRSRKRAELAAETLLAARPDDEVFFYHAGLTREEKRAVEAWFYESRSGVLCATCAYGMGVDKSDIRTVIHLDLPGSVEAYLQESGRGGRDRTHAEAVLLSGPEDDIAAVGPADPLMAERGRMMREYVSTHRCRRDYLMSLLGAESDVCFGCDVCAGNADKAAEGLRAIVSLVRRKPRRLTVRAAAEALCGDLAGAAGEKWAIEDYEYAITAAVRIGAIRRLRHGPWKNLLALGRRRKDIPNHLTPFPPT